MRNKFDTELENLNLDLIRVASLAEDTIASTLKVLEDGDLELARSIIANDDVVDNFTRQIESRSMKLIMRQQPVAKDLRAISTALKMITDIERICDISADIAEIALLIAEKRIPLPVHFEEMSVTARKMVNLAVESFVKHDVDLATEVIAMDSQVDRLYDIVKREMMELATSDKENVDTVVDYLMIAKYFERIGDHAENIADWSRFSVTGIHKDSKIL